MRGPFLLPEGGRTWGRRWRRSWGVRRRSCGTLWGRWESGSHSWRAGTCSAVSPLCWTSTTALSSPLSAAPAFSTATGRTTLFFSLQHPHPPRCKGSKQNQNLITSAPAADAEISSVFVGGLVLVSAGGKKTQNYQKNWSFPSLPFPTPLWGLSGMSSFNFFVREGREEQCGDQCRENNNNNFSPPLLLFSPPVNGKMPFFFITLINNWEFWAKQNLQKRECLEPLDRKKNLGS